MAVSSVTSRDVQSSLVKSNVKLPDILKTLPRECFQQDWRQAWKALIINVICVILGYGAVAVVPWFLLPIAWVFLGTALTGFFVLAHDCGHRSFAKRRWLNDWIGHILLLPLIYPFHSWRILHNRHHRHTNKLDIDNAWQPFQPDFYTSRHRVVRWAYQATRGYFWWLASILHWSMLHFDWKQFQGKEREQVRLSVTVVLVFAAIAFPLLFVTTGVWGVVKFWLLPWLVYHFWMSTFTLVHHTAPHIQFRPASEWNAAEAQLAGSVHCDYPRWVEFLCHDINVHVPHHVSTAIPFYRLRLAHQSLMNNWGEYMTTCQFSWALMHQVVSQCHLYEPKQCYLSFQEFHHQGKR